PKQPSGANSRSIRQSSAVWFHPANVDSSSAAGKSLLPSSLSCPIVDMPNSFRRATSITAHHRPQILVCKLHAVRPNWVDSRDYSLVQDQHCWKCASPAFFTAYVSKDRFLAGNRIAAVEENICAP